jgi:hypothetical protein
MKGSLMLCEILAFAEICYPKDTRLKSVTLTSP